MKPLNGRCAMTREERNARRRELDLDAFHHSLSRKVANAWREKHRDELNARRRAKYAANRERERARCRAWREANPELKRAAWQRWAKANREKLRKRDRLRYADPEQRAKKAEQRKAREATPEGRAKKRAARRYSYHKLKHSPLGFRRMYLQQWSKLWPKLVAEGEERIEKYHRRAAVRTWSFFLHWRRGGEAALENLWGVKIRR